MTCGLIHSWLRATVDGNGVERVFLTVDELLDADRFDVTQARQDGAQALGIVDAERVRRSGTGYRLHDQWKANLLRRLPDPRNAINRRVARRSHAGCVQRQLHGLLVAEAMCLLDALPGDAKVRSQLRRKHHAGLPQAFDAVQ